MSNEITVDVTNNTDSVVQIKKDEETKVVTVFINELPITESKLEKASEMQKLNKQVADSLKENGDNLLFGGEDKCNHEQPLKQCSSNARQAFYDEAKKKCITWPAVGDKVLTTSNQKAVVMGLDGEVAWIKYEKELLGYAVEYICALKKPKTQEEKLAKNIADSVGDGSVFGVHEALAKAIINGEIEGLSYKPQ